MNLTLPVLQVCPLCGHEDNVTTMPIPDSGGWTYTCQTDSESVQLHPYSWSPSQVPSGGGSGIMYELGLFDDLPDCLISGEQFVEHGVVEHRYKLAHPDIYFGELLPQYGHVAQGPKRHTLSSIIAQALGHLSRRGVVYHKWGSGTGFWDYNARISSWALTPVPPIKETLSWTEFATKNGLDRKHWSLIDPR